MCEREAAVLAALRAATLPEWVVEHACACPSCAELVLCVPALAAGQEAPRLPSADFLWWKAQLAARRDAVNRALRPVVLFERAAAVAALVVLAAVATRLPVAGPTLTACAALAVTLATGLGSLWIWARLRS